MEQQENSQTRQVTSVSDSFMVGILGSVLGLSAGLFLAIVAVVRSYSGTPFFVIVGITLLLWGAALARAYSLGRQRSGTGIVTGMLVVVIMVMALYAWLLQHPLNLGF